MACLLGVSSLSLTTAALGKWGRARHGDGVGGRGGEWLGTGMGSGPWRQQWGLWSPGMLWEGAPRPGAAVGPAGPSRGPALLWMHFEAAEPWG